jgi:membrane fusion protein (multidrug efflux system)
MPTFTDRPHGTPRRGRRRLLAACAAALLAAGGLALSAPAPDPGAESLECMVAPYLEVKVTTAVSGVLEEVQADRGDFVTKGQVLATLRSGVERAAHELARAKVAFAERKVLRNKELYRKQMISIHEKDELETELELLKLEMKETEERLKERTLLSPLNGVVTRRYLSPGEFVDIQQTPVMSLAQIDPLRVEVAVPVSYFGRIRAGMTAEVVWEEPIGTVQPATVKIVDPVVDAASGTIGVRLELPNPKRLLPAGTKCSVRFPVGAARPAGKK